MINNQEYLEFTRSTAAYPKEQELPYLVLGLTSEAGEVAGKVKKIIRDNNGVMGEVQRAMLIDEIGDVAWYLVRLCDTFGLTIDELLERNFQKLSDRKARGVIAGSGDKR